MELLTGLWPGGNMKHSTMIQPIKWLDLQAENMRHLEACAASRAHHSATVPDREKHRAAEFMYHSARLAIESLRLEWHITNSGI
jgi:hypothetical protein